MARKENIEELKKQPSSKICSLFKKIPFLKCKKSNPTIAILRLSGVIGQVGHFRSGLTLESLNDTIEEAFKLPKLKAIALVINSPGGSPVQSELIYKRIRNLAEEKNIEVLSFVEDVAASGGYWLACTGDEIYASENSIIGSIGVIAATFGFQDAIKKLGVERRIYTQGENKSILDPFLPEKESDIRILTSAQKDIHESFKNLVRARRAGKLKGDENDLFSGEFWSGKKAEELGLIDRLDDIYSVIKEKYGEKVNIQKVGKEKSWLKRKLGLTLNSFSTSIIDYFFEKLESKAFWNRFGL
jgi:signal peptide peptidase SppA